MTFSSLLLFLALGALFGFLGGLFGIGGATIGIPVLGIAFGMSEQLAQGTALAMALPNVIVGLWRYALKAKLDVRIAVTVAVVALPMTFVSPRIATQLPSRPLRIGFAIFLLFIAADIARRTFGSPPRTVRVLPWPFAAIVGGFGGAFSGFFGIGGALITVPAMTMFFGLSQLAAQGMSLAYSAPTTIVTLTTYALAGDVDWTVALPLAVGGVATVSRGVDLAHRLPERVLRTLFIAFVIGVAIALMFRAA